MSVFFGAIGEVAENEREYQAELRRTTALQELGLWKPTKGAK